MTDFADLLFQVARTAIAEELDSPQGSHPTPEHRGLQEPGASFVTLTKDGELRGCIGTLVAYRPLADDVAQNARAAAFHDPRFPPVTADELDGLRIEVSVLTEQQPIQFDGTERNACEALRPHADGVVLHHQGKRATFLPQVWDELPHPEHFLRQLKRKAGLDEDFWSPEIELHRYEVRSWQEP